MSKDIHKALHELQESGYTLVDLLLEIDAQLDVTRNQNPSPDNRLVSIARTDIESGRLRLKEYQERTGKSVPLLSGEIR